MSNDECIFCRIATGKLPADIVYEDDELVAFRDVNPQAPTHILVIPRAHIPSLDETTEAEVNLLGRIQLLLKKLAAEENLEDGYRVVVNTGPAGGQSVHHIHYHLLGGRSLEWPPG